MFVEKELHDLGQLTPPSLGLFLHLAQTAALQGEETQGRPMLVQQRGTKKLS